MDIGSKEDNINTENNNSDIIPITATCGSSISPQSPQQKMHQKILYIEY